MDDDQTPAGEGEAQDEETNAPKYEWPGVRVLHLDRTPRVKHLTALRGFCELRQHDHHRYDFAGRPRPEGARGQAYIVERMMRLGVEPDRKPAYEARKPDVPIPLQRQVVQGFDEMVYPRGLAPTIEVPADPRTERYLRAVMERSLSWVTLQAARGEAGKTGEAALRVGVDDGKPISEVLDTRELYVRLWANQMDHVPEVVVWQRLVEIEVETDKGLETVCRWRTRIFDGKCEYVYQDVAEDYGEKTKPDMTRADGENADTGWIPIAVWTKEELDELEATEGEELPQPGDPKIIEHQAGRCPIVWIQNTHSTQDPSGEPDCEGVHQLSDAIDLLASMNYRATRANLDPTLHVKDVLRWHRMNRTYEKGWQAVIRTSENGDAKLLETAGQTVEMGWKTYNELRKEFLHTVRCVIIDPEHAGQYAQSGVAHAMLWRPMESAAGKKRVPQALAIQQVFELWMNLGEAWEVSSTEDEAPAGIVLPPVKIPKKVAEAQGYTVVMELEPKEPPKPKDDDSDEEPPELEVEVLAVHQVGAGKHVELIWPPYHETTAEQFQLTTQAVTVATGGAKILSQRTGTRLALQAAGMPDDVDGEIAQIDKESEKSMEKMAGLLGAGEPPDPNKPGEPEDDDGEDDDEAA